MGTEEWFLKRVEEGLEDWKNGKKGPEVRGDVKDFLREHVFGHKHFQIVMGMSEAPGGRSEEARSDPELQDDQASGYGEVGPGGRGVMKDGEKLKRTRSEERRVLLEDLGSYWAEMVANAQSEEQRERPENIEDVGNSRKSGNPCQGSGTWAKKETRAIVGSLFLKLLEIFRVSCASKRYRKALLTIRKDIEERIPEYYRVGLAEKEEIKTSDRKVSSESGESD